MAALRVPCTQGSTACPMATASSETPLVRADDGLGPGARHCQRRCGRGYGHGVGTAVVVQALSCLAVLLLSASVAQGKKPSPGDWDGDTIKNSLSAIMIPVPFDVSRRSHGICFYAGALGC